MDVKQKYRILFSTLAIWIVYGTIIGLIVGSTTALLLNTNDMLGEIREKNGWLIYLLPLGGIIIGYLYMHYGKEQPFGQQEKGTQSNPNDSAKGNNLVIEAVHGKARMLKRTGPLVYLGTFLTILLGGSTGREGAAIQMGGSVAEGVIQYLKVKILDKQILLICGISAGFGAAFGAPITGAIFGMEMTALGKMKYEALVPCLVASFTGHYITTAAWGVKHEHFVIQTVPEHSLTVFIKVILLAVVFSLLSVAYSQLRHGIQNISEKLLNKNHIQRAFLGGVLIVILTSAVGSQDYNGRGLDMLEQSFQEEVPPFAFIGKLVFTAITMGSGFVGGEAIPLFYMGATLGNTLAELVDLPISFMAALGMIATFCGGANTPIAAFLLGVELFNGKGIEYFFVACLTSYIFSGHHGLWPSQTIYEPKSRLYSIANEETIQQAEQLKKVK